MDKFTSSIAYMNYSYKLLAVCALFARGLIIPRCINVVVLNSLYMVLKIWISREAIFGHKEAIILHVRNGIDEKKRIPSPIVTDSSHKNSEVGTVVPKNAVPYVGVFLLNNGELCAIHSASTTHGAKEKRCSYIYTVICAKDKVNLYTICVIVLHLNRLTC